MLTRTAGGLAAFTAFAGPGAVHEFKIGTIEINHPWSRPTPPSAPVASGSVKLTNSGSKADRLLMITSPISERAEIHRSIVENRIASMCPVDGLAVEPGATVDFQADKLHVMFIDPARPLKDGDRFPATLTFENAGAIEVQFVVQRKKMMMAASRFMPAIR